MLVVYKNIFQKDSRIWFYLASSWKFCASLGSSYSAASSFGGRIRGLSGIDRSALGANFTFFDSSITGVCLTVAGNKLGESQPWIELTDNWSLYQTFTKRNFKPMLPSERFPWSTLL